MSDVWRQILARKIDALGRPTVCRELDLSATTISLILNDKYPANTDHIEQRVMTIYGQGGQVACPVLGEIDPSVCIDKWELAQKIKGAGNPATIRLYIACRKCDLRSN